MSNWFAQWCRRASLLVRRREREREMDEEMRFHIEMEARELARDGLSADAAERQARLRFGGVERYKEDSRDARGVRLVEDLMQDVRYAARQCVQQPSFTIATVLTLSLSIGASTFMYSFANMTPVPFDRTDRLVYVRQFSKTGCPSCQLVASGNALTFARSSRALESMSFVRGPSATPLRGEDHSEVVRATAVTFGFFNTIGVQPMLGRAFLPSDSVRDAGPVALISEALWRRRFGADSGVVGRDIVLDGKHSTVRGVIARDDVYPERTEAWTLMSLTAADANEHASNLNYVTIARLRDGATREQAEAEAATVSRRLASDFPSDFREWQLDVRPLRLFGIASKADVGIFIVAAAFVLVIACTNLTGVLVARLTRRRRELAVRAAMGAGAWRITRQLLTETVLVCIASGLVAVGVAQAMLRSLVNSVPDAVAPPGLTKVVIDWQAFTFALALASACGLVIALWPALRFARPDLNLELRDGVRTRSSRGASGGERVRRTLVVLELALSVILLAAAGLLVRSEAKIARAPVGLSADHVLTMNVQLPTEVDGRRVETRGYFDRLAQQVARVPGVRSAGAVAFLPLSRSGWSSSMFQVEGRPRMNNTGGTRTQVVTPGYFDALRIPILRGRTLTDADVDSTSPVALVNETLARRFFPDDDPIGRVLALASGARYEIVGIVADVKQQGAAADPGQEILMPAATVSRRTMTLVVRTAADPASLTAAVVKAIGSFDPNLAISRIRTMSDVMDEFLQPYRIEQVSMTVFAAIAIVIATMGLYAIMSYTVASRTREFGVRLALGATGRSLLRLVLRQGLRLATAGVVIGLAGALATMRLMRSRLYEVAPTDPLTLAVVVAGVGLVTIAAALLPAQRAVAIDPVSSLRVE